MKSATTTNSNITLVTGGTGKTGRRIVQGLKALGRPTRVGSRSADIPFDWNDPATWAPVLEGVSSVYIAYQPDLAVPAAPDTIRAFTRQAVDAGVRRLVLLSGRGEREAERSERIVREAGVEWTILRASWFAQNFSEGFIRDLVMGGTVALPADDVREPFVDVDDIAEVAVAALTEPGHAGELYEITGPRLMTFADTVAEIQRQTGRSVQYAPISLDSFTSALAEQQVPADYVSLLSYLFTEVLDGRNSSVTDGVQRALGREPRDFAKYVQTAAAAGAWTQGE